MMPRCQAFSVFAGIVFPSEDNPVVETWSLTDPVGIGNSSEPVTVSYPDGLQCLADEQVVSTPHSNAFWAAVVFKLERTSRSANSSKGKRSLRHSLV
jgi:hypothetical protein